MIYHRLYHEVRACRRYALFWALLAVGLGSRLAAPSSAQTYPTKPVRIIVPTSPGGITDTLARALAQRLTETFGQTVIVENRPAGAGQIGMDFVAKSPPDGYTLMVNSDAAFVVNPHLYSKLPYDSMADFIPISGLGVSPQALVLHPSVPANTLARADRLAKTKPGELNYGTFGIGTSGHLNIMHLESETGTKFTPVHYRGAAPAITDLLGGHIQMMIVAIGLLRAEHRGRQAQGDRDSAAAQRLPQYPDLPTLSESGLPELRGWLVVRPRRAQGHAARDRREAQRRDAEDLRRSGVPRKVSRRPRSPSRLPARRSSSPNACSADLAKWGKVIKDANSRWSSADRLILRSIASDASRRMGCGPRDPSRRALSASKTA